VKLLFGFATVGFIIISTPVPSIDIKSLSTGLYVERPITTALPTTTVDCSIGIGCCATNTNESSDAFLMPIDKLPELAAVSLRQ
jgi:hypothetical protein